ILRRAREVGAFINFDMESYRFKDITLALFKSILEEEDFREESWHEHPAHESPGRPARAPESPRAGRPCHVDRQLGDAPLRLVDWSFFGV
ncbi:MAG: hypothetical protein ACREF9_06510, partial [Opitutaceae bacterium]